MPFGQNFLLAWRAPSASIESLQSFLASYLLCVVSHDQAVRFVSLGMSIIASTRCISTFIRTLLRGVALSKVSLCPVPKEHELVPVKYFAPTSWKTQDFVPLLYECAPFPQSVHLLK